MTSNTRRVAQPGCGLWANKTVIASAITAMLGVSHATTSLAQTESADGDEQVIEEVVVTGIRGSLRSALEEKRQADN